jgi:hypothetical protein
VQGIDRVRPVFNRRKIFVLTSCPWFWTCPPACGGRHSVLGHIAASKGSLRILLRPERSADPAGDLFQRCQRLASESGHGADRKAE